MYDLKVGDIIRLTNKPFDWDSGEDILFAVVETVYHLDKMNMNEVHETGSERFNLRLMIMRSHNGGPPSPKVWGVFIEDVKPVKVSLSDEPSLTNFKWAR